MIARTYSDSVGLAQELLYNTILQMGLKSR